MKYLFKRNSRIQGLFWVVIALLCVLAVSHLDILSGLQNKITEIRASKSTRAASSQIVFIGIDKDSIDYFGVWPWPRTIHAKIVDRLLAADVTEIGMDIDFSAASTLENDKIFTKSLEKAGGAVVLPTFVQDHSISRSDNELAINAPLPMFAQHSWIATVNVVPDADGVVRRFPIGHEVDGTFIGSMPSVLSGVNKTSGADIVINYSIDPKTIPEYSVIDLLSGKIGRKELEGKSILVGAQAVELRDNFTVPVHGALPGAIIQVFAAETLLQGIDLISLNPVWVFLLFACIVFVSSSLIERFAKTKKLRLQMLNLAILVALLEGAGFYLYNAYSIVLPTAQLLVFVVVFATITCFREIILQHWLVSFANINFDNTQNVLDQVISDNANAILVINENCKVVKVNNNAKNYFNICTNTKGTKLDTCKLPNVIEQDIESAITTLRLEGKSEAKRGEVSLFFAGDDEKKSTLEYAVTASKLKNMKGDRVQSEQYIACVTAWDITARIEQDEKISYLAKFDNLTGAMRRNEFESRVNVILAEQLTKQNNGKICSILTVNLHRFKTINVTLGRETGNQLLRLSLQRLKFFDENIEQIARIGGDTFAICLSHNMNGEELKSYSYKLIDHMIAPFHIGKAMVRVGLRIGAATFDASQNISALKLLENSELALDEARKVSGNSLVTYHADFSKNVDYTHSIENALWNALERDEIYVVYQPQINIETEELIGVEALLRWNHPSLGSVSPEVFIQIADANGFLDKLGLWALNRACNDALLLPDHVSVAVNVSPSQFMRSDVAGIVEGALKRTGLPAHRLHIEITESGFLDATNEVVVTLEKLSAMEICIALDDFGTGFSSLGYFSNFPIDKIKVDQMFVRTLERGSDNEAIIRSVKELSNGLNLQIVCEGIETQDQLLLLREIGVHQGQGYLFGKPQPLQAIIEVSQMRQKLRA